MAESGTAYFHYMHAAVWNDSPCDSPFQEILENRSNLTYAALEGTGVFTGPPVSYAHFRMINDTAKVLFQNTTAQVGIFLIKEKTRIKPLQFFENLGSDEQETAGGKLDGDRIADIHIRHCEV